MRFVDVAETSRAVAGTSARSEKIRLLSNCLRRASAGEADVVASYLAGELRQRRTGLGYAALRSIPPAAGHPELTLSEVDAEFARIAELSGKGSTTAKRAAFHELLARVTEPEQRLLAGLVTGEVRQGALDGLLTEAVATATDLPAADVRRAVTVAGALVPVAAAALADGADGLERFRLTVGSPVRPMLASPASTIGEAIEQLGEAGIEWKLDGVRVQVHRDGTDVRIFSRTLDDITDRVPEIVDAARALPARSLVLDAEALALDPSGRPLPFQRTSSRIGHRTDVARAREQLPLAVYFFDCLHLDGADLLAEPGQRRWEALAGVVPAHQRIPHIVTDDAGVAENFFADAIRQGHEGIIAKSVTAPYEAGRRGSGWLKVKPRHTLDLVILAAEWGSGRRRGWLSNLHLGARDPQGRFGPAGGFVMLGKTFKGLTDQMLTWQTDRLRALADGPTEHWVVHVRPELLAEIAFDGVQASPRYPAGVTLRFARVLHHRPDKPAAEADTIESVLALHHQG
ncbi:ATP-dependent DNA ligase [Actinobacteria bacterium YIM 96077]|uniref:Probable DNA ligase n=1 Tax=Phytoactinopolyspora halophila TaxID=1981511 RepID=A0A329QLW4_9ACTN|nr:ATP-dependent DNA ligase [Phytoactinopolyspora halophila]AYY13523.1 ATP-dependent DNA ligase [Actinobacteria bacterium YIM 96077]RAW12422.1 ATP-dependent DNA ligase [Phytoactinopolyspora halophila]